MRRPENLKLKYFLGKMTLCDVWKLFSYVFLWRWRSKDLVVLKFERCEHMDDTYIVDGDQEGVKCSLVFHINKRTFCEAKHEMLSVFKIGRSTPHRSASGSLWQFQIFTVWANIWKINWHIYPPPGRYASESEWQFHISTVRADIGRSNVPFHRCLHWELRQTRWQIYPHPLIVASSGQEWQFHISTIRAHIGRWSGRSTGRSTPPFHQHSCRCISQWQEILPFSLLLL